MTSPQVATPTSRFSRRELLIACAALIGAAIVTAFALSSAGVSVPGLSAANERVSQSGSLIAGLDASGSPAPASTDTETQIVDADTAVDPDAIAPAAPETASDAAPDSDADTAASTSTPATTGAALDQLYAQLGGQLPAGTVKKLEAAVAASLATHGTDNLDAVINDVLAQTSASDLGL